MHLKLQSCFIGCFLISAFGIRFSFSQDHRNAPQGNSQHQPASYTIPLRSSGDQQPQNFGNPGQFRKFLEDKYHGLFNFSIAPIVVNLPPLPNLSPIAEKCPKNGFFYSFSPLHMEATKDVRDILLSRNSTIDILDMALALQKSPDIHPHLWFYAVSSISVKNPDFELIHNVEPVDALPELFIPAEALAMARGEIPDQPAQSQQPQIQQPQPNPQPGQYPQQQPQPQPGQYPQQQPQPQPGQYPQQQPQPQPGQYPQQQPQSQPGQYPQQQPQSQPGQYAQQSAQPQAYTMQSQSQPGQFQPENQFNNQENRRSPRNKRQQQRCVPVDERFGSDNGIENRLWYFRESIAINSHHWYYHAMYPFSSRVREDRRGELFYYMHSSMVARYNAERLANGLGRVQPLQIQRGIPLDGYNAHLRDDNSGASWTDRRSGTPMNDIFGQNNANLRMNILVNDHLLVPLNRILEAIDNGYALTPNNQRISLLSPSGIDILGDLIQASGFSINPNYYGGGQASGFHNTGHVVVSFSSDPQFRQQLPPGVMADSSPAMRDVVFYRWHALMNQIFDRHKRILQPYTPTGGQLQLLYPGISISSIAITPTAQGGSPNQLNTFWSQRTIQLRRGLDMGDMGQNQFLPICAKELNHEPFIFQFTINRDNNVRSTRATVRIFMAPRFDENGNRFNITTQRSLFFVLDTFAVNLNPGPNQFTRRSTDSLLTLPWSQTVTELNGNTQSSTPYCGCGWPENMLLPRGTTSGMIFDLFIMVTNGDEDTVQQFARPPQQTESCIARPIYCGLSNQLYPDSKPMGYPFDRFPYSINGRVVDTLDDYVRGVPNMGTTSFQIRFNDVIR